MKSEFLKPRFEGVRFAEHTLPLEIARDLAAYETLVVELAKHLYLKKFPHRQRVPKGFEADFNLHLQKIEDGSAKPLLSIVTAGTMVLAGNFAHFFERARDVVTDCIASADGHLPADFPRELLAHFNHVGQSLRPDESLELPRAGLPPAVLTPDRRKRLVLAAERVYERPVELTGTINEVDWLKSTFRIRTIDGLQTIVPMPESFHQQSRELGGRTRHQVTVRGIGAYDSWDQLQKVVSVDSFEIQRDYVIAGRLDELSDLSNGWCDGVGVAPDKTKLSFLGERIVGHYPERLPLPLIVPTQEGNLLFEWKLPGDPSLDMNLQNMSASFHGFTPQAVEIERDFELRDDQKWMELFAFLDLNLM
jgi:hypothetical protein